LTFHPKGKNMKYFYPRKSNPMLCRLVVNVGAAIILAGCASAPAPVEQMAVSRASLDSANTAGSNEFAPLQIKSALEKMAAADLAMANRDYVRARQLAEQAQVDALLAIAIAQSVKAQKAADALQENSRVLHQEINRQTK
jgi:hypothetical protein